MLIWLRCCCWWCRLLCRTIELSSTICQGIDVFTGAIKITTTVTKIKVYSHAANSQTYWLLCFHYTIVQCQGGIGMLLTVKHIVIFMLLIHSMTRSMMRIGNWTNVGRITANGIKLKKAQIAMYNKTSLYWYTIWIKFRVRSRATKMEYRGIKYNSPKQTTNIKTL